GPTFPELVEALAGVSIIDRGSVNAFDDARTAHAIEATGRKKLIFAGLSLEVCAAFPAITAISKGLDAYVAVDACGTFNDTKRQLGIARLAQAGVIVSDYATLMMEVMKDNERPEAGAVYGAIDMDWAKLVGQLAQAYGKELAGRGPGVPARPHHTAGAAMLTTTRLRSAGGSRRSSSLPGGMNARGGLAGP